MLLESITIDVWCTISRTSSTISHVNSSEKCNSIIQSVEQDKKPGKRFFFEKLLGKFHLIMKLIEKIFRIKCEIKRLTNSCCAQCTCTKSLQRFYGIRNFVSIFFSSAEHVLTESCPNNGSHLLGHSFTGSKESTVI